MKIVYISTSTVPSRTANSIHVMKMCQALANAKSEVALLVPDNKEIVESKAGNVFDFYNIKENFRVITLPWLPFRGKGHIYAFLAARKAFELKPDLIYCRNISSCFFSLFGKTPVILESHAPAQDAGFLVNCLFKALIRRSYLHKLVVITRALKDHYCDKYPKLADKIEVLPDCADPIPHNVKPEELPGSEGRLQVGYVGHLYEGKGIEVVQAIAPKCSWADFHIVGGLQKNIEFWKNKMESLKNVHFHGFVAQNRVVKFIKAFDVCLLPNQKSVKSFTQRRKVSDNSIAQWTSPLKMFEYMAAGKPIVASDLPVLREVLAHERNALLCDPTGYESWVSALLRLNTDAELKRRLGENAYDDYKKEYTWDLRAEKIIGRFKKSRG